MLLTYLIYYIALVMTLKGMRRQISQKKNVLGQACDAVTDPGRLYHMFSSPKNWAQPNLKFIIQRNCRTTDDLTKKCKYFNFGN